MRRTHHTQLRCPIISGRKNVETVLGSEVGGRWSQGALQLVRDLVRIRAQRAPPALRQAAASAWARRWWSQLSVSVQQAVASKALGCSWPVPHPSQRVGPDLDQVLHVAEAPGPSRLPLR